VKESNFTSLILENLRWGFESLRRRLFDARKQQINWKNCVSR